MIRALRPSMPHGRRGTRAPAFLAPAVCLVTLGSPCAATAQTPADPDVVYAGLGIGGGGRLITIDPATGAATSDTLTGVVGGAISGLAIHPDGTLFAVDGALGDIALYTLDAADGTAAMVDSTGLTRVAAIAFGPDSTLYASAQGASGIGLYTIDPATAGTTFVGGTTGVYGSLAFDGDTGFLYGGAAGFGRDDLWRINPATAADSLIGETGFNQPLSALAFGTDGQLWGAHGGGALPDNEFLTIDKTDASAVVVGPIGWTAVSGMDFRGDDVTAVSEPPIRAGIVLHAARPNPLRTAADARIAFELIEPGRITLEVFDVAGRRVRTLADRHLPAGTHEASWDGTDGRGRTVPGGVYFYRLRAGDDRASGRQVVIR